ncbi:MAG: ferritin-like domain-containing protein [Bacillota bacterium]
MTQKQLFRVLNYFIFLERRQVEIYLSQSARCLNRHLAEAFHHFAVVEQGHVDNLTTALEARGGRVGPVAYLTEGLGTLAGRAFRASGARTMLRLNVAIETKAATDYRRLIARVDDPQLRNTLISNCLEEEMHAAWMDAFRRGQTYGPE